MRAQELIRKKRNAGTLTRDEIRFLIQQYTRDSLPDYQMAAWLMAVYFRGMTPQETSELTDAMMRSGQVLDLSEVPGVKVDKHSTGGVGDKVSLVVAPVVAAAGVPVPMISGRALGHSGGTLDKLEAIPGFSVNLSLAEFRRALAEVGCALIGQTNEIAPADKKIYALRDLTGTIESVPLITASILSKKLAEGIEALVLDVKVGSGAFMKDRESARRLAESLREIGARMGKRVVALLTRMDQPLGCAVGNALEVEEAVATLHGEGPRDLRDLCQELAAWMLVLAGAVPALKQGRERFEELIRSGAAAKKFQQIITHQGGDPSVVDDPKRLPQARKHQELAAKDKGYLAGTNAERIGWAAMALGAGRTRLEDAIDPAVGLVVRKKVGEQVERGEPLATLHFNDERRLADAQAELAEAFVISSAPPAPVPLIFETLAPFPATESSGQEASRGGAGRSERG
ncbi:thymidine phosphorylase [Acidobacteriia bacterium AH_259_A11_L15]|nr:thymidine phosphorylase [Acidobacteriia bacterium AH_259_A11_L15]